MQRISPVWDLDLPKVLNQRPHARRMVMLDSLEIGTENPHGRIAELAERRLHGNSHQALKNVSCTYQGGVLVLQGTLPTYYLKQIAQETIARMEGVERIENQIHFDWADKTTAKFSAAGSYLAGLWAMRQTS
jgi:osmotically-inducible protein OsmY